VKFWGVFGIIALVNANFPKLDKGVMAFIDRRNTWSWKKLDVVINTEAWGAP
jgi:hypothetical protein